MTDHTSGPWVPLRAPIEVDGKTYRVYDVGSGPRMSVRVSTGPNGRARSWFWREVPRGGKTWKRVMQEVEPKAQ